jgi:hypothetical protein
MMNRFITVSGIVGLLLVSAAASADPGTVAVLRPSYEIFREGTQSEEDAEAVFTMIKHAVKEAGMNVAEQAKTDAALQTLSGSTAAHCDNQSCLKIVAESAGAWNAVAVRVIDKEAHFILSIKYAVGDELEAKVFGNRASLMEDIFGNVEKVLSSNAPKDPVVATGTEESSEIPEEEIGPDQDENTAPPPQRGLKPNAFYVSAAVTAALAIGWGTVEIIGYAKSQKLEDRTEDATWQSDRDDLKPLRTVDGILLGAAAVGAITTTILFFLTDFDQEAETKAPATGPSISTGFLEGGAIMTIKGTF